MRLRSRLSSRLTLWAFAAALLLQSAVPMLASAAAALQGKPLAEVCDVYGVDLSTLAPRPIAATTVGATPAAATADAAHAMHHGHGGGHPVAAPVAASLHEHAGDGVGGGTTAPAHQAPHSGDHCVLTGMVALAAAVPPLVAPAESIAPHSLARVDRAEVFDAAARWASRLGHGPPARS